MMPEQPVFYGFPYECRNFEVRHPSWSRAEKNLAMAMNLAFTRVQVMDEAPDKLVYFLGRIVLEDFWEIALVCHHGYGVAASKLVRSMYEYTVTLHYLHDHPEESHAFLDYHLVQEEKLINRLIETFGNNVLQESIISEARRKAAEVKEDFMVPVCDHPGARKRLNISWNKLDFVAMAKKVGKLGDLIVPGYYMPLRHAHATFGGLSERMEIIDGNMSLKSEAQPEIIDRSLITAHNCMLDALQVQNDHFKIGGLHEAMQTCLKDFYVMWAPDSPMARG